MGNHKSCLEKGHHDVVHASADDEYLCLECYNAVKHTCVECRRKTKYPYTVFRVALQQGSLLSQETDANPGSYCLNCASKITDKVVSN